MSCKQRCKNVHLFKLNIRNKFNCLSLNVDGLIVSGDVVAQHLRHGDGHSHRVGPLGLHDVRHLTYQVLARQ